MAEFDGILPGVANKKAASNFGRFFAARYIEYGRLGMLAPFLNPIRDTCGAALTLYLIEVVPT